MKALRENPRLQEAGAAFLTLAAIAFFCWVGTCVVKSLRCLTAGPSQLSFRPLDLF